MDQIEIAKSFSLGQFSSIYQYLDDGIVWDVIGENSFIHKANVVEQTKKIERYLKTINHHFQLDHIHITDQFIIIQGQANFQTNDQTTTISACDIYEFNTVNQIIRIQSYCIKLNKE